MSSDGTDLFLSNDAGNESNADNKIRRVSISGTTLTQEELITCAGSAGEFDSFMVDSNYVYSADVTSPYPQKKYNRSDGALVQSENMTKGLIVFNNNGTPFLFDESDKIIYPSFV